MARGFLILLSFFTRVPVGNIIDYNEIEFRQALCLYSLVGCIVGIFLCIGYSIGEFIGIPAIKGLIVTIFYIIITGGIHLDGASDTTDGLFSGRTGDRIFEIMSDSRIGSFGVISLILILASQIILFSNVSMYTVFITPIIGRACVIVSCYNTKYAKHTPGMGTLFIENIKLKELLVTILIVSVSCFFSPNTNIYIFSSFITLITCRVLGRWIVKKINGMTGDTCGFVNEISQIVFLMIYLVIERILIS